MGVLMTFLYILLFIFCLSVLIVVHELGHFATAKFFKVYCKEFSIGFGPALFHKKRKNGETYFSLRAIPFGGYVSMYGEGMEEDPEFKDVDPSRSFTALKKWKRIIILFAGVFNNAILALVLFLISESCFAQKAMYLSYLGVDDGSKAAIAGIVNEDYISVRPYTYEENGKTVSTSFYIVDKENAFITYNDDTTAPVYAMLDISNATYTSRSYDDNLRFFQKNAQGGVNMGNEITASSANVKSVSYTVTTAKSAYKQYLNDSWILIPDEPIADPEVGMVYRDKENKTLRRWNGSEWVKTDYDSYGYTIPENPEKYYVWLDLENEVFPHDLSLGLATKEDKTVFEASGLSFFYEEYWNDAGQVFSKTFIDFGDSATAIGRGVISLFTSADTWKDVGGIVAIGVQTTNILQNFGLAKFIYIWGLISVNLAIINLLPFPGLDGWQIVVLIVEAVAHRDIPDRVKNIVSFIGLSLLFALMILILIKDVIGLF